MENLLILPSPDCFPALKLPPFEPWNTNTNSNVNKNTNTKLNTNLNTNTNSNTKVNQNKINMLLRNYSHQFTSSILSSTWVCWHIIIAPTKLNEWTCNGLLCLLIYKNTSLWWIWSQQSLFCTNWIYFYFECKTI